MEFSTETYPSHQKGTKTRAEILAAVMEFPGITALRVALQIEKSEKQVKRHLQRLIAEGKVHNVGGCYFIGRKITFIFLIFSLGIF